MKASAKMICRSYERVLSAAVVTGSFSGMVDFGQGPLTAMGIADIWLAKLP